MACMSTSSDPGVALGYAAPGKVGVLFKITTTTPLQRGADLRWVSAFPAEMEFLYPPLVFLRPTGKTCTIQLQMPSSQPPAPAGTVDVVVIEVEPQL